MIVGLAADALEQGHEATMSAELSAQAEAMGFPPLNIRAGLRTGDTTSSQRAALLRRPPHILVTTPESLYILLTSDSGREMLRTVKTVIVDEIHALARDKRGSHLALSLERLEALTGGFQRIGLSATQRPIERILDELGQVGAEQLHHSLLRLLRRLCRPCRPCQLQQAPFRCVAFQLFARTEGQIGRAHV